MRYVSFYYPVISLLLTSGCHAGCYFPDGSPRGQDSFGGVYEPCNSDGTGMCCALGRPASSPYVNFCRSDGLCDSPGSGEIWRESCADPTWKDPKCIKLCIDGGDASGDSRITVCDDGSYCCGQSNSACCNAGVGYLIVNGLAESKSASSLPQTLVSTIPTAFPSSPATQTYDSTINTPSSTEPGSASDTPILAKPKQNLGQKIQLGVGISIGVSAALAAIAILFARCIRLHRRKSIPLNYD